MTFFFMSTASTFTKKILKDASLAQIVLRVEVLNRYLEKSGFTITRTRSVGRVKATSWLIDFGIAADEQTIHVPLQSLTLRLPENELDHWLSHVDDSRFSENFLKMQSSHACIDDGNSRQWNEPEVAEGDSIWD
jgi:hypothetical protein